MSHRWTPSSWGKVGRAFHLWHTHAHNSAASPLLFTGTFQCRFHVQQPYCFKAGYLSQKHTHHPWIRSRKAWLCRAHQVRYRLGLHTSTLYLNPSASRWSAGLSQHMSRVRNTLDTVSKAVSGRHTGILAKIARLKPSAFKTGKNVQLLLESTTKGEENVVTPTPATGAPTTTSITPEPLNNTPSATPPTQACATFDASAPTSPPKPQNTSQAAVTDTMLTVGEIKEKRLRRVVPAVKAGCARKPEEPKLSSNDNERGNTSSKQTTELFHPSTFSVNLDETYNYLAHHINSYFDSSGKTQDKKLDNVAGSSQRQQTGDLMSISDKPDCAAPVTPPSSKKGLGRYLSYSAPTVQAFVGSYIAPLVPKFRTGESTSATVAVKKTVDAPVKQVELTMSKEQKAADDKAKKLLLQREKVGLQISNI